MSECVRDRVGDFVRELLENSHEKITCAETVIKNPGHGQVHYSYTGAQMVFHFRHTKYIFNLHNVKSGLIILGSLAVQTNRLK